MRKLKLLLAACALFGVTATTWADTNLLTEANGWQKITELPSALDNYYFTIVDNSYDLMLALSRGGQQQEAYNGLYYANSANPLVDKSMLFTLQKNGNFWVMTNAEYKGFFLQTESNAAWYYRTHDNGGNNLYWGQATFAYSDGAWTIQNGVYPDSGYLGPWSDEIGHGKALAFNKTGNSIGKFQIYAILKTKANEYYDALRAGTGASETNPMDMTALLVNPNARFWTGEIPFGWTTTGKQNVNNGNGYDLFPGIFEFSNWEAGNWTGSVKQTVTVPNGKYIIKAAFMAADGVTVYLTSNGSTAKSNDLAHFGATGGNIAADGSVVGDGEGDRGWTYLTLETKVTTGSLELGAYAEANAEHLWVNADNFTLTYLGADLDILKESYQNALNEAIAFDQSTIKEIAVKEALADAISTYTTVDETEEALTAAISALQTAIDNATASVAAYAAAKVYLDKMTSILEGTNVYTNEAYNASYGDYKTAYDNGTLTTENANYIATNGYPATNGWHHEAKYLFDDILLSTWTIGGEQCANYNKALYINTWSIEGNNDGSDFVTPFFEYWTNDDKSLGANTLVSTMTGLKASTTYSFTIRARVRQRDQTNEEKEASTDVTKIVDGITMKVGGGAAVDISAGAQFNGGKFYIGNFSAVGQTDSDGKLVCTITVAENSNISWLSFYDCKYTEGEDLSAYIADYEFALANVNAALTNDVAYTAMQTDLQAAATTYAKGSVDETSKTALIAAKEALETALAAYNTTVGPLKGNDVSKWTTTGNNGSFQVNTWSGEGNTDGSNMTTPFTQNWVNRGNNLTDAKMSYTVEGLTPGYYKVSALIRSLNEAGGATPAGSFIFANDAIERAYGDNSSNCTNGVYANPVVYGLVGSDGKLTLGVKVIKANVNWVSWKNFTYEYVGANLTQIIANNLTEEARTFVNTAGGAAATAQANAINALGTLSDANYTAAGQAIEAAYKAIDRDFTALNAAIAAAENGTLGFEAGEFAPYNLAPAKAIDQNSEANTQAEIDAAATACVANTAEVNAFYDGDFSECAEDNQSPLDYTPAGWTHNDNMRMMLKNTETYPGVVEASANSAMMSWSGGITYGEQTGYEMPLKPNALYTLKLKAAGWNNETRSGITVSVLNAEDGMAAINLGTPDRDIMGNEHNTAGMTSYEIVFVTGAAGNYVFHVQSGNNMVLTDFEIKKAASQVLEFADGTLPKYAPGTYPSVKINRQFKADYWSTAVYPFAVSASNIAVLDSYNNETGTLAFKSATTSEANVPFMIKNDGPITLENVTVAAAAATVATAGDASLKGVYTTTDIDNTALNYVLSENKIYKVGTAGATINPYRAYIQIAEGGESRLTFTVDGETTAIEGVAADKTMDGTIYNLSGQRVKTAKKGVYVVNGKAVIVK